MNNKEMDFYEQLMYLKDLTVRFGVIHEAQGIQLRNYPILIPGIMKGKALVDTDKKVVIYECEPKGKFRRTKQVHNACKYIDKLTKKILWDETTVVVNVSGEGIYDSRTQ